MVKLEEIKKVEYKVLEITSLPQTHQKYIYMRNNCQRKITGYWQKDSRTAKAERKIHTESGRKGREVIRQHLCLREETQEEKDYTGKDLPWDEWCKPHTGCPSPGV